METHEVALFLHPSRLCSVANATILANCSILIYFYIQVLCHFIQLIEIAPPPKKTNNTNKNTSLDLN